MGDWEKKIDAFENKINKRSKEIFQRTAFTLRDSVVQGSPITGAPGQPVDTNFLRSSWQLTFPASFLARLVTNVAYAPAIEENTPFAYDPSGVDRPEDFAPGPIVGVSETGGPHSVKLTRAGYQKIVNKIVREVAVD